MTTAQSGVCYSASLPLSWRPAGNITPAQTEHWRQANISLLRALAHLESLPGDLEKELGTAAKAYERLEAKVDVMLDMLGQLLAQGMEQPVPHRLTLWPEKVEWLDHAAPPIGSEIQIALYLSPKLPQPLNLAALVESAQQEGSAVRVLAKFTHLNEELTGWLERTVFRYHRRSVQQQQAHQGN